MCPSVDLSNKYLKDLSKIRTPAARTNESTAIPLNTVNGLINPIICATIKVPTRKLNVLRVYCKPKTLPLTLSGVTFCNIVSSITRTTASDIPIGNNHIQALLTLRHKGAVTSAIHKMIIFVQPKSAEISQNLRRLKFW